MPGLELVARSAEGWVMITGWWAFGVDGLIVWTIWILIRGHDDTDDHPDL